MAEPLELSEMAVSTTNLFGKVQRETAMDEGHDCVIQPLRLDDTGDIEFICERDELYHIDPKIHMYCKFRIIEGNGKLLKTDADVSLVNSFGTSLFQSCDLTANDERVTENTSECMAYKNYIEQIASANFDSRSSSLQTGMFYQSGTDDLNSWTAEGNTGYDLRKALIAKSNPCEFVSRVGLDVLTAERLFPPRVKLGFRFTRSDPKFYILAKKLDDTEAKAAYDNNGTAVAAAAFKFPEYRAEIMNMHLIIRKIKLDNSLIKQHQTLFQRRPAQYPYCRTVIKKHTIPKDSNASYWQSVFVGKLPQQLIIGLVKSDAEMGAYDLNPFYFDHFQMTHASAKIDGVMCPTGGFTTDFPGGLYMKMLRDFYDNVGHNQGSGCIVNYKIFAKGYCLPTWNFNPDKGMSIFNRNGSIDIHLEFKVALTENVTILALAFFEEVMTINQERQISTTTRPRYARN